MALTDTLTAFWKLDEANGATRVDMIGSNDLADTNTVTQVTGKVGNGAQFTAASSQLLSDADNADMSTGNVDFTWAGWVYVDSKPTSGNAMVIAAKWLDSGDQREWQLELDADTDRFRFKVSKDGTSSITTLKADNLGSPALDTWYLIVVEHDADNDTMSIQVNNGAPDIVAYALGCFDSSAAFQLGSINGTSFFDGIIDAVGWWKKTLSTLERTQLYNGGDGLEAPFETSSYTPIETVVTQSCDSDTGFNKEMILPRFAQEGDDVNSIAKFLDEQAEIIEDKFNSQAVREVPCEVCVTTGAIVLDCGKCTHFEVAADADINSISFINCVAGDELDILFRASKDIEISGWPNFLTCAHCGTSVTPTHLSSGEIFRSPVFFNGTGGASRGGGTAECIAACVKKSLSDGTGVDAAVTSCFESCGEGEEEADFFGRGGRPPAEATGLCQCVADEGGLLTVSICKPLNCDDEVPELVLTVCGGAAGDYTWSVVGGESPTQVDSGSSDRNTTITPPTNTTPGESGIAYAKGHGETRPGTCPDAVYNIGATYDCSGTQSGSCTIRAGSEIGEMPVVCDIGWHVVTFDCRRGNPVCGFPCVDTGACDPCEQKTVDMRTQGMIDNGCKPCAATMQGAIVSVTDSSGAVVSTIIETTVVPTE